MNEDLYLPQEFQEITGHHFKVEMELTSRILSLNEQSFDEVRTVLALLEAHSHPFALVITAGSMSMLVQICRSTRNGSRNLPDLPSHSNIKSSQFIQDTVLMTLRAG